MPITRKLKRTGFSLLVQHQVGRQVLARAREVELRRRGDGATVSYDPVSGGWLHATAAGTVVLPEPRGTAVIHSETLARDVFLRRYTPAPGDVVLDVGAGVGTEVLTFADLVGEHGRIIAVEAHPATYRLLERTCELSGLEQVETLQLAVVDHEDSVTISDMGSDLTHINRVGEGGISVASVTIRTLMEQRGLDHIDFVKMNIEGAETAALLGAGDRLADIRHLAVGCHDFLADETGDESYRTKKDVTEILRQAGFQVEGRESDPRPWAADYLFAWRA